MTVASLVQPLNVLSPIVTIPAGRLTLVIAVLPLNVPFKPTTGYSLTVEGIETTVSSPV